MSTSRDLSYEMAWEYVEAIKANGSGYVFYSEPEAAVAFEVGWQKCSEVKDAEIKRLVDKLKASQVFIFGMGKVAHEEYCEYMDRVEKST